MAQILIAGCGYVGNQLSDMLVTGHHQVWGLRRSASSAPAGQHPFSADLTKPETLTDLPKNLDYIFYTASASSHNDEAYQKSYPDGLHNLIEALQQQRQKPNRIFFTSSTGVYGQYDGSWIDETSPTLPASFSGKRMLEAERRLLEGSFPATVVRLGGIYGPGRTRLVDQVRDGKATAETDQDPYTNRIHRHDAAGILKHLMDHPNPDRLYLGVDQEPALRSEVYQWIASQLQTSLSPPVPRTQPGRPQTNKRCRNNRLLDSGYVFQYPTFREGYQSMIHSSSSPS